MAIDNFSAELARAISESVHNEGFDKIIENIRKEAEKGKYQLHMYESFSKHENKLKELGYKVDFAPSIAIQKDGHYGTISW